MEKKEYTKPAMRVVRIQPTQLLMVSGPGAGDMPDPTMVGGYDPMSIIFGEIDPQSPFARLVE
ncbi:MAG: hypothetical protein IJ570_01785 [Prevotella sp.]|nr:hypothetical protein [Prevotella sp.]